jgi:NTE family protein
MPVDRIGGTSMGAIVAAGVAIGWGDRELKERMHQAFVESNPLDDYTIPWVALFRGESVDRALRHHFGEAAIESLWRPFFCISTNLTQGGLKVHRQGSLWRALRASVAIPGVLPPVLEADEVLVDGDVVDNFPVDVMAGLGRGPIVGIDVAGDLALTPGSEIPLNRHGLIGLIRPKRGRFPGIVSILSRVGTVSSQLQKAVARAQVDLLVEPSLNEVPLLDWRSFERAIEAGYRAAAAALEQADRRGLELRGLQI